MKFPKLITRRRLKWTGLAATLLLGAGMIASYWLWPSYIDWKDNPPLFWRFFVRPGGMTVWSITTRPPADGDLPFGWSMDCRYDKYYDQYPIADPIIWLPDLDIDTTPTLFYTSITIPFWMPLALCAVPTAILFYRDRKPKPGYCTKCRYDLAGLSGDRCPECGTKIATTDSHKPPASTAGSVGGRARGNLL